MKYISTRGKDIAGFRQAIFSGLAADGGLYMPEKVPTYLLSELIRLRDLAYHELAHRLLYPFVKEDIPEDECLRICRESFDFPVPLVRLYGNMHTLELFHGPTLAFKDFGARFLARTMGYFAAAEDRETLVLVATSGDTGGAVAHGFYQVPGIRVGVLYPDGKVSPLQEKQFASLGGNILALKVKGSFDDCQQLVKSLLVHPALKEKYRVTTANSINVGRLLPQMVYYVHAWLRLPEPARPLVMAVPSGNYGNLTAGLLAHYSGMPVERFIAASNVNRVFPDYLETGDFRPRPSLETLANAMDVGNPSNTERIFSLFSWDHSSVTAKIHGFSLDSDNEIRQAMKELYEECGYRTDPHSAIGWAAIRGWLELNAGLNGVFLETAHPGKFYDRLESWLPGLTLPDKLGELLKKKSHGIPVKADIERVAELLLTEN